MQWLSATTRRVEPIRDLRVIDEGIAIVLSLIDPFVTDAFKLIDRVLMMPAKESAKIAKPRRVINLIARARDRVALILKFFDDPKVRCFEVAPTVVDPVIANVHVENHSGNITLMSLPREEDLHVFVESASIAKVGLRIFCERPAVIELKVVTIGVDPFACWSNMVKITKSGLALVRKTARLRPNMLPVPHGLIIDRDTLAHLVGLV